MDLEWLGGRYTIPDGSETEAVLWLELPTGLLLGADVIDSAQPDVFAGTLRRPMREPGAGPPRRPSSIRVGSDELARQLRREAGGIPVIVAPVPELDDTFQQFLSHVMDGGNAGLVRAARRLREAEPWRRIYDAQVMRVDILAYEIEGGALSIVGAGGGEPGLLLFRSPADYADFAAGRRRRPNHEPVLRCVLLPRGDDAMAALSFDAARNELAVTAYDVRVLTVCTLAFLEFFSRHAGLFEDVQPRRPVVESITGEDGVTVTITAPYPTGQPPKTSLSPRRRRSGRSGGRAPR
ncbi:MAG TPA: hypothetical protein VM733_11690 [Thermoanaerobaculia bacterium]|nr:hypothetical protein [Thermoanaerobaculia bacterium]